MCKNDEEKRELPYYDFEIGKIRVGLRMAYVFGGENKVEKKKGLQGLNKMKREEEEVPGPSLEEKLCQGKTDW